MSSFIREKQGGRKEKSGSGHQTEGKTNNKVPRYLTAAV